MNRSLNLPQVAGSLLLGVVLSFVHGSTQATAETVADMQDMFSNMRYLLPLSVTGEWRNPGNATKVLEALDKVSSRASLLGEHAQSDHRSFKFLGEALSRDLQHVSARYRRGDYKSAGYLLLNATDYCATCHTRLPSSDDTLLTASFVERTALATLPSAARAQLEVATRQFGEALSTYESLFASADLHASLLFGSLIDYVIVSVRVTRNPERAASTLEAFSKRTDAWLELRRDLEFWVFALRDSQIPAAPATLVQAQALMEQAAGETRYYADRRGLVYYILASAVLHRFVETNPPTPELAEAYYLLGLTKLRTGRDYWVAQGEMYLETAIRLSPGTTVSVNAYGALEDEVMMGYSGSGGVNLPDDQRLRLARLRDLATTPR